MLTLCDVSADAEAAELAAENPDGGPVTINLEPTLDDVLEEGIRRLQEKNTWKLWQWPTGGKEFYDADTFRYLDVLIPT